MEDVNKNFIMFNGTYFFYYIRVKQKFFKLNNK